jgi:hypothetical protein
MRYTLLILILLTFNSFTAAQQGDPSSAPKQAMIKLQNLQGNWEATLSTSFDRGVTWKENPPNAVNVDSSLNDLLLTQQNTTLSNNGWNMMQLASYDQYRETYRLVVIDDTWGLMDVYEGQIDAENRLTIDNLNSATFFPGQKKAWVAFRLSIELTKCSRATHIDASIDKGKTWVPYMVYRYERLFQQQADKKTEC